MLVAPIDFNFVELKELNRVLKYYDPENDAPMLQFIFKLDPNSNHYSRKVLTYGWALSLTGGLFTFA